MENEIDTEYYINNTGINNHGYAELLCESKYYIESFDSRKVQMTHPNRDICTFSLYNTTLNTPGYRSYTVMIEYIYM